jgi:hypothetical protein
MKKLLKKLEELNAHLEELIATRKETYQLRSETWQESAEGYQYDENTGTLSTFQDEIVEVKAELANWKE